MEKSDAICSGLQLANFWQDISVDFSRNRIYLPEEPIRHPDTVESYLPPIVPA